MNDIILITIFILTLQRERVFRRNITNLREKGELIEKGFCRRFKKSKRHKEDYALLDFEGNTDYVEMVGNNKKWHFLDFSRKFK